MPIAARAAHSLRLILHQPEGGVAERERNSWTGLMEVLARTRTVVAADRRGHGDSDPYTSSYRLPDDVDDPVAIVTDLAAEAGEAELAAVSAGCHVALAAAVAGAPAARAVALGAPGLPGHSGQCRIV